MVHWFDSQTKPLRTSLGREPQNFERLGLETDHKPNQTKPFEPWASLKASAFHKQATIKSLLRTILCFSKEVRARSRGAGCQRLLVRTV
jgi:hypothetical protein